MEGAAHRMAGEGRALVHCDRCRFSFCEKNYHYLFGTMKSSRCVFDDGVAERAAARDADERWFRRGMQLDNDRLLTRISAMHEDSRGALGAPRMHEDLVE